MCKNLRLPVALRQDAWDMIKIVWSCEKRSIKALLKRVDGMEKVCSKEVERDQGKLGGKLLHIRWDIITWHKLLSDDWRARIHTEKLTIQAPHDSLSIMLCGDTWIVTWVLARNATWCPFLSNSMHTTDLLLHSTWGNSSPLMLTLNCLNSLQSTHRSQTRTFWSLISLHKNPGCLFWLLITHKNQSSSSTIQAELLLVYPTPANGRSDDHTFLTFSVICPPLPCTLLQSTIIPSLFRHECRQL